MSKLELKYIAPYLPYGLKWEFEGGDLPYDIVGLDITYTGVSLLSPDNESACCTLNDGKPILRRVSSINAEEARGLMTIIYDTYGEVELHKKGDIVTITGYIPYDLLKITLTVDGVYTYLEIDDMPDNLSTNYFVYEYLFKRHFDVFGLIEKGLAIDKNTIE